MCLHRLPGLPFWVPLIGKGVGSRAQDWRGSGQLGRLALDHVLCSQRSLQKPEASGVAVGGNAFCVTQSLSARRISPWCWARCSHLCGPLAVTCGGAEATCGVTGGELAGQASAVDMLGEAPAIGGQEAAGAGIGGRLAWPLQLQVLGAHFPLFNLAVSFCPRKKIYLEGWAVGAAIPISLGQSVPFLVGWGQAAIVLWLGVCHGGCGSPGPRWSVLARPHPICPWPG